MLAIGALARRRDLLWSLVFIAVSILPLSFIPQRGGFAYLVPSVGWAVYAGGLLSWLTGKRPVLRIAILVAFFAVLAPWQRTWIGMHAGAAHDMQARYRRYLDQIRALIPAPRKGARILLLSDAEGRDDYDVYFLMRLYYGDPTLDVRRATILRLLHHPVDPSSYDYVLDWRDGRFVRCGAGS